MSRAEDIFQKLIYFGEDAIDEFILNQQTEELFLDFKQAVSVGKNFTTLHRDRSQKPFQGNFRVRQFRRRRHHMGRRVFAGY